jgi:hypothetical protein
MNCLSCLWHLYFFLCALGNNISAAYTSVFAFPMCFIAYRIIIFFCHRFKSRPKLTSPEVSRPACQRLIFLAHDRFLSSPAKPVQKCAHGTDKTSKNFRLLMKQVHWCAEPEHILALLSVFHVTITHAAVSLSCTVSSVFYCSDLQQHAVSWVTCSRLVGQESPCHFWNTNVHFSGHRSSPLDTTLGQTDQLHTLIFNDNRPFTPMSFKCCLALTFSE